MRKGDELTSTLLHFYLVSEKHGLGPTRGVGLPILVMEAVDSMVPARAPVFFLFPNPSASSLGNRLYISEPLPSHLNSEIRGRFRFYPLLIKAATGAPSQVSRDKRWWRC